MFMKERHELIVQLVNEAGRVTVTDLAQRFDVSEDSIRRDLNILADQGQVERVYGGAICTQTMPERSILKREESVEAKRLIAKKAYEEINEDDTIYLDVSTTVHALAECIAEGSKHCTVVSNSLDTLQTLAACQHVNVIGTGGLVHARQNAFVGASTLASVDQFRFSKSFIGALSIDMDEDSVTTFEEEDGLIKRAALKNSRRSYLLADANKFSRHGNFKTASIGEFSHIICDEVPQKYKKALREKGLEVLEA